MKKNGIMLLLTAVFTLLFFSSCGNSSGSSPTTSATLRKGPYLLYPGANTSMTVMWQADSTPSSSTIEWGPTSAYGSSATVTESSSSTDGHLFSYTIPSLTAGARTYYKVTVDSDSYASSFMTAPDANASTLVFYGYGDTRTSPDEHNAVVGAMLNDIALAPDNRQTLLLHGGDFVHYGLNESYWDSEYFYRTETNVITMLSKMPVLAAMGNHEMYVTPVDEDYEEEHAGELFRKYWPNPLFASATGFYFSFDYGPLHVAAIDQYVASFDSTSTQYTWLENDLTNSTKPWKLIVFHAPAYSATPAGDATLRSAITREDLVPLFEQQHIKVVMQSHQHYYSRSAVNGVTYLVLGGGGASLTTPDPTASNIVTTAKKYHVARFEIVDANTMNVTIIDENGATVETFQVTQ